MLSWADSDFRKCAALADQCQLILYYRELQDLEAVKFLQLVVRMKKTSDKPGEMLETFYFSTFCFLIVSVQLLPSTSQFCKQLWNILNREIKAVPSKISRAFSSRYWWIQIVINPENLHWCGGYWNGGKLSRALCPALFPRSLPGAEPSSTLWA